MALQWILLGSLGKTLRTDESTVRRDFLLFFEKNDRPPGCALLKWRRQWLWMSVPPTLVDEGKRFFSAIKERDAEVGMTNNHIALDDNRLYHPFLAENGKTPPLSEVQFLCGDVDFRSQANKDL